ncbi:hypothetical protein F5B20DRAFT_370025 [Whalleya microplaca]|nr:hypothetical protein F5B20DRAFT_370025 [Whalleya microplaca]
MSPVAFQILSDLHLETHESYNLPIKQTAPYLALLGDIGHVADDNLFKFLEKQLNRYWVVFFLLGNHEPIQTSWPLAKQRVRAFAERMERLRTRSTIGKFVFLDQTRYNLNDTLTVLGCTLFSRVDPEQAVAVETRFVDFNHIQNWTVSDHNEAHKSDLQWLNTQVCEIAKTEPRRQVVIFTHHSPTLDENAVDPSHLASPVMSGFVTDLAAEECWRSQSVVSWGFGHTHFSCDFTDSLGKRVIANQKGYAQIPAKSFDAKKLFLIGRTEKAEQGGLI